MDPVVHFEFPYDDRDRIAKFYQSVFGWELRMLGEDMGNYVVATTAKPEGEAAAPASPGWVDASARPGFAVNPALLSLARAESQMNFRGRLGHGGPDQGVPHRHRVARDGQQA